MPDPTRRSFLGTAGAMLGLASTTRGDEPGDRPGLRVAVVTTAYHYLSHAYHIVGRFLDGVDLHDGRGPQRPGMTIASLFIEQTPANDLGRALAGRRGLRLSPTIADALTLGTGRLDVDAILLIGEHGDYPYNAKLQKLYPRARFFSEIADVCRASGRGVPVFIDKHLSIDRAEAAAMIATAQSLKIPLMAGSSLPVTWRLPELELPIGSKVAEAVVASRGEIEVFGFHALEALQCQVERRDRGGRPQGVAAVTCLTGEAVRDAEARGVWSRPLLDRALGRSHTRNVGDLHQNTRDFTPPPNRPTFLATPIAFVVEYVDGLKATALILNGHVDDTTCALRLGDGREVSTLYYLPAPPGANFFDPLVLRIAEFFRTGRPPYPVERTQLTGGILDAALESRVQGSIRVETPDLAAIDYAVPADSGFIRTPIADFGPN